jgi:anti-sigma B factor antagonist
MDTRVARIWGSARSGGGLVSPLMSAPALPPFEVSTVQTERRVRMELRGELDMSSASVLRRELESVERGDPTEIVLDLAELSFMDVSGLRAILDAARRGRTAGRSLVISNPMPHIVRLLELTAIDQSVPVQGRPLSAV